MAPDMVEVANLTKIYRKGAIEIKPLEHLDLTVAESDFVALMGPSGSGKTTLLNIIAGIDDATEGTVVVGGVNLAELTDTELSRWRTRNVGYIFQLYNLVPVLTAYENVELPLLLLKLSRKRRKEQTETALKAAGILDRQDHYPRQLSGGQEQRVAIARAIVTDPKIIIADEPTGDLDAVAEVEIMELLTALNREFKKTMVMVTHDPKAASYARRIVRLEKGVLVDDELPGRATPDEQSGTRSETHSPKDQSVGAV
ncbi:MAG: ABC transporter ATP-binding protein [Planctomycetota bacterium]|nr:MAG: ABC transporter ATP-binding protein [Planctomycetota bacterium]